MEETVKQLLKNSLAAFKQGDSTQSLAFANQALVVLEGDGERDTALPLQAKAFHRKAAALGSLGDPVQAVRVYREGLAACGGGAALAAALKLALQELPPAWHATYWAQRIEVGQAPAVLSTRDGRQLAGIPQDQRLSAAELRSSLEQALERQDWLLDEVCDLLVDVWSRGQKLPDRAGLSFVRGWAYLQAARSEFALADGKMAIAYGARDTTHAQASGKSPEAEPGDEQGWSAATPWLAAALSSRWPAALSLLAAAYEAEGDNVRAALIFALASEKDEESGETSPGAQGLSRLRARVPEEVAAALDSGGSSALLRLLNRAHTAAQPEVLRQRPKYYYYYEWMKKRITEQYPTLPEPVMDKLLTVEAGELDLVLQYPQATQQMVENLLTVLEDNGPAYLETYRVPLLSWENVKQLKGSETIGLPLTGGDGGGEETGKTERRSAGLLEGGSLSTISHTSQRSVTAQQSFPALSHAHDESLPTVTPDPPVLDALD